MPKKSDAFLPRIYPKTQGNGRTYYIKYWTDRSDPKSVKFHKSHDGKCMCGKPRPNRPCPHYEAAQEVLKTFEHRMQDKALDATVEYMVQCWEKSDHSRRRPKTVELYLRTYKVFLQWCNANRITHASQLADNNGKSSMAEFKAYLTVTPFKEAVHTKESRKILRKIDYAVVRDGITRDSPEYQDAKYQNRVKEMEALMTAKIRNYKPNTIHRMFRELRVLFQHCTWNKMMQHNPLEETGKPKSQRLLQAMPANHKEINPLTDEERVRLIAETSGDTRDIALTYLLTGMRLDELANLHWKAHVRPDRIYMCPVNGWEPKWGKSRTIPLHPKVKEVLERQRAKHPKAEYVFNTKGHIRGRNSGKVVPYLKRRIQDRFKKMFEKLAIVGQAGNGVTIHCFRHTFITRLLIAGESIVKVRDIAGHKDVRTTMRYYHAIDSAESSVLANLD